MDIVDDEVLRILTLPDVPDWSPGENDGEVVNTLMTIPVKFRSEQTAERDSFFPLPSSPVSPASKTLAGETVFDVVEDMPAPPGGLEGWNDYISDNLSYPEEAKNKGIEGTVYITFIVDKEGRLTSPSILRGIGGGADQEALRLIENSPAWTPGMQGGQKVHVKMRLPIRFKLPTGTRKAENPEISAPRDKIRPDNTLNEVTVIGYGSSEGYISAHTTAGNTLLVSISEEGEISLNGKTVDAESLEQELRNNIKALEDQDIAKNHIVASITAYAKTPLGKIHDIQEILRKAGIHKVEYSNFQ